MKGYKVVTRDHNSIACSSLAGRVNGVMVHYDVSLPAVPPEGCGPLAVFKRLRDAKSAIMEHCWYNSPNGVEIWRCKYKRSKHRKLWYTQYNGIIRDYSYVPDGTDFADSVTLISKVKRSKADGTDYNKL